MILYRVVWLLVQVITRLYWRVSYEGTENVPTHEPFVLAPVHRSFLDFALVSGVTKRRLWYMAKEKVFGRKAFDWFLYALGAFPVRRGGPDREAMRRCMAIIDRGEPLVMFPEGTRRRGPVVEHLHEGPVYVAARTGVPIVPVGIGGSERSMPRGKRIPRPVKVYVVVGPPIRPPKPEEGTRVSRRVLREVTIQLQDEVQRLFDLAQDRAGVNRAAPSDVE